MKARPSTPSRLNSATIFGSFFVLAGFVAFFAISGPQILRYFQAQSWERVPVQLSSLTGDSRWNTHDGSSTRVYSLQASYRYNTQGQSYTGSQVTLDDGYDSEEAYWRALELRIRRENIRQELQAWVNPDEPHEAILERGFRWMKLVFALLFLLIFSGVGSGIVYLSSRQSKKLGLEAVKNGIEPSNLLLEKVFFFIASFIFLMSAPVLATVPRELAKGNTPILFAALFPVMGFLFLYHALQAMKRRKIFGKTLLMADPLPGCAGGQVGGAFDVRASTGEKPLKVRLECTRISRGKNSNRSLIWQDHQIAFSQRSAIGSRHQFSFHVAEDLPESSTGGRSYIEWSVTAEGLLIVEGKPEAFSRTWTVPVIQGAAMTSDTVPMVFEQQAQELKRTAAKSSAAQQISSVMGPNVLELISRSGRHGSSVAVLGLMGAAFFGAGLFPLYLALKGDGALWFFAVVFCLVGMGIIAASLWSWGRRLEVRGVEDQLWVIRSLFSKPLYQRRLVMPAADDVRIKSTMSSRTNGQATREYFALVVDTGDKSQVLAEGIEGRHAADALLSQLQKWLQLRAVPATSAESVIE